jgi:hypothetical protein
LQCGRNDPKPHDGDDATPNAAEGQGDDIVHDVVEDRTDLRRDATFGL